MSEYFFAHFKTDFLCFVKYHNYTCIIDNRLCQACIFYDYNELLVIYSTNICVLAKKKENSLPTSDLWMRVKTHRYIHAYLVRISFTSKYLNMQVLLSVSLLTLQVKKFFFYILYIQYSAYTVFSSS
jgi:hypothetical protein